MRTLELVALDWGDIDFVRGMVMVTRAILQKSKLAEATKSSAGRREVKLLASALEALKTQKQYTFMAGAEVFQNQNFNERWSGDKPIRKVLWAYVVKRSGVRYRHPYQTRHTDASVMLSADKHPMLAARQMGTLNGR